MIPFDADRDLPGPTSRVDPSPPEEAIVRLELARLSVPELQLKRERTPPESSVPVLKRPPLRLIVPPAAIVVLPSTRSDIPLLSVTDPSDAPVPRFIPLIPLIRSVPAVQLSRDGLPVVSSDP